MTRTIRFLLAVGVLLAAGAAYALPVVIPDFGLDPSGPAFTIQAVPVAASGPRANLTAPPDLLYGQTSEDGTPNTLQMSWQPLDSAIDGGAGASRGVAECRNRRGR